MKEYSAYLFDMDGTLVASEKLKGLSVAETCRLFGGEVSVDVYKEVMGEKWEAVTSHFFSKAGISPDRQKFNQEFRKIYEKHLLEELEPNCNAISFLKHLKEKGKKTGLVSSASGWMVEHVLKQLGISAMFDVIVFKEHVTKHKPDPESYLLAIKKLGTPQDEVLIFEDSKVGLIAAERAGCDAVAFRHEFNVNNDLSKAVKVITDYQEIEID